LLVVAGLSLIAERSIVVSAVLGAACVREESRILSSGLALLPPSETEEGCDS
jgi:deoxycytidylate deaminase